MTTEEYVEDILGTCHPLKLLSHKNGCRVIRLRHKKLGRDMILRSYPTPVLAYRTLLDIKTEYLPTVYDVITLSDGEVVLEEFIDGMTLCDMMEVEKHNEEQAKSIIHSVCMALDILHGYGIVHRDVKPENVILGDDGRVALIDLNASRKVATGDLVRKDTVIMGTVGYASPEQLGLMQSDSRTDVYAVGVMLNVMLTGKHPTEQLAGGKYGAVVRKCTHINPDNRYQSALKLAAAL